MLSIWNVLHYFSPMYNKNKRFSIFLSHWRLSLHCTSSRNLCFFFIITMLIITMFIITMFFMLIVVWKYLWNFLFRYYDSYDVSGYLSMLIIIIIIDYLLRKMSCHIIVIFIIRYIVYFGSSIVDSNNFTWEVSLIN